VGCHFGTSRPLGRLADHRLRSARRAAHAAFDPLWRGGPMTRAAAYRALADSLGLPRGDCHIGGMDEAQCAAAVEFAAQALAVPVAAADESTAARHG